MRQVVEQGFGAAGFIEGDQAADRLLDRPQHEPCRQGWRKVARAGRLACPVERLDEALDILLVQAETAGPALKASTNRALAMIGSAATIRRNRRARPGIELASPDPCRVAPRTLFWRQSEAAW